MWRSRFRENAADRLKTPGRQGASAHGSARLEPNTPTARSSRRAVAENGHPATRAAKEVLIFEPDAIGHQMYFVRMLADSLTKRGLRSCLITSADGLSHTAVRDAVNDGQGLFSVETLAMPSMRAFERKLLGATIERKLRYSRLVRRAFADAGGQERFCFVIIPFLDSCLPFLVLNDPFFGTYWSGITMRTRFHMRAKGMRVPARLYDLPERLLFRRAVNMPSCAAIFTIDPYLAEVAHSPKVIYVPDAAEFRGAASYEDARRALGIAPDAFVLLAYGVLDGKKRIALLLDTVAQKNCPAQLTVLLAGTLDREIGQLLERPEATRLMREGRLKLISGFISDADEQRVFAASDVVWVVYDKHYGSSGTLIKAGQAVKPVISCEEGMIGRLVSEHSLGIAIASCAPSDLAETLSTLVHNPNLRRQFGEAGLRLFSQHTPQAFGVPIVNKICTVVEHDA